MSPPPSEASTQGFIGRCLGVVTLITALVTLVNQMGVMTWYNDHFPSEDERTITGYVVDRQRDRGVADAVVTIDGQTVTAVSGSTGAFRIVLPGQLLHATIRAHKPGYKDSAPENVSGAASALYLFMEPER